MRIATTITLLIWLYLTSFAQQVKQYSFKHFSVSNGLAANRVTSVVQDHEGYIWMATSNGLQRYDGNSFLTFQAHENNPASIPVNDINALYVDKKGNLWLISDNDHIGVFNTKNFTYQKAYLPKDEAKYLMLLHLTELATGELLLIKDSRAIFRYSAEKNTFIPADYILPYPKGWKVNEITWDAGRKKYWISCDSGLAQYDPATRHINYRNHNIDNDPVIAAFAQQRAPASARADSEGNVFFYYWVPTEPTPYIVQYNRRLQKATRFSLIEKLKLGYHEPAGFLTQRNGRTWIYGMPFFAEWHTQTNSFISLANEYKNEQSIRFDYLYRAIEDREGNIWLATDNGVFLFNPDAQLFNTYNLVRPGEKIQDPPVQAIEETGDGRILVGCWGGGLFCFDTNFNSLPVPAAFKLRYRHMSIWDMALHSKTRQLWITQQGGVIDIYDPKTEQAVPLQPAIFGHSTIRQIDEDTSGNLWFGTQSGKLIKWNYQKANGNPQKGYELIYQTSRIFKVHYDYAGYIWLATMGNGLIKIDAKTHKVVRTFTTESAPGERLFMNSPGDMTYYDDSTLIVSARCLNIINTKTNKVRFITTEDGLPSNTTESLQRDKDGIVWIGMTNGICRLNMQQMRISYYDRRDGIAYDKFSTTGVAQLSDKRMVFFTDHNFLVFHPEKIVEKKMPPPPYITSFRLSGRTLSVDSLLQAGKVMLRYNNTSIGIDFSALSYLPQRKLHYYYMLNGLDKEWIHTDHPREVIYNYLPPGNYEFKVKSENADGVSSGAMAAIAITVRPPIWNTWWFYGLVALLIILVLYLIDRERMNKRRSLQQMRSQIGTNMATEISTTLNNINVLSEIAKIKADKNIEQSKDFIDQISGKSRYMIEAMEDVLWSIDPQNDSMKKTLLRMKELTEGVSVAHQTPVDLIVDKKVQTLALDMKLRYELFFFYKEALTFLVEQPNCRQLFININQVKSKLLIELLCECADAHLFKTAFQKQIAKRVSALAATIDVLTDAKSFSAVLYVRLK